jgi:hypothetical protein
MPVGGIAFDDQILSFDVTQATQLSEKRAPCAPATGFRKQGRRDCRMENRYPGPRRSLLRPRRPRRGNTPAVNSGSRSIRRLNITGPLSGSWSSSSAIRLCPHRSGHAACPHPALPEGNPRHIRACAQERVMRGAGSRKRAVRVSNSGQPMRRLFWLRRLRQRSQVRRTSR